MEKERPRILAVSKRNSLKPVSEGQHELVVENFGVSSRSPVFSNYTREDKPGIRSHNLYPKAITSLLHINRPSGLQWIICTGEERDTKGCKEED